jgi:REP element-mobilizing transposase RayT
MDMARNARKDIEGNYFHVMVQGIDREYVFPNDDCKGYYLACLQRGKEKYPTKLLAFCVMGNHAHMLVKVENTNELSAYFKQVNALYANYYNRVFNRVGYVFRGRFRSQLITDVNYLCFCLAYIQNNPVDAGIVARAEDYGYSSYGNYLNGTGIVDFNEAKKHFDITPGGITGIMQECSRGFWMEHEEPKTENKATVLRELMDRYNVGELGNIKDMDIAAKITAEIQTRCGVGVKEMAQTLGVGRETLRKTIASSRR